MPLGNFIPVVYRTKKLKNWPRPNKWAAETIIIISLELTQPLTEMGTRNLSWGKALPVTDDDNSTISEPIVEKMWDPRQLTNL
jgi:hypothetical protein